MIIELVNCRTPACVERGDVKHRVEWNGATLQEARRIQKTTGQSVKDWDAALGAGTFELESIEALLMWGVLVHARLGIVVDLDEVDFEVQDFQLIYPDVQVEVDAGKETPTSPRPESSPDTTSGASTGEASTPRSSTTPPTSGGGSDSP